MRVDKFRLLFFGSDAFSVRILESLLRENICPVKIVTKPHTIIDQFAQENRLSNYYWQPGLTNIHDRVFNIGLVASFGQLIDSTTVKRFQYGLFNTHPSLLPKYRGSTPIQSAVLDGLKETGSTIMKIPPVERFDIGDIIIQEKLEIRPREYAIELRNRLADLSSSMVKDFLLHYELYLARARSQNDECKSFARKLRPEQGCLRFKTEPLDLIDRKILAYTGFIRIYTECLGGFKVELEEFLDPKTVNELEIDSLATLMISSEHIKPGLMYFHKYRHILCLMTSDKKWVACRYVTPYGRTRLTALDFYNGYLSRLRPHKRLTDF